MENMLGKNYDREMIFCDWWENATKRQIQSNTSLEVACRYAFNDAPLDLRKAVDKLSDENRLLKQEISGLKVEIYNLSLRLKK